MSATNRSSSSVFLPPSQTRLVTIAAHVDHGKTTLADNLIEANGLISERLAGTLRYLDSDPEEQRRGITMRSSAIGLQHHVIHLYDSPGHTDFSREVSSAMSCCDTALLVVDAVEGMGPRTHQVFREAYAQQLVPILVLNKIDRLCLDLRLTPTEAYLRLRNLLETVNAAASTLLTSSRHADHASGSNGDPSTEITTELETQWTFDPARNNVVFASALFGFGFTAQNLARALYQTKAIPSSLKPPVFRSLVFADAKLKGDKVLKWKARDQTDDAPIFAIYGLQPLWDVLEGVATAAAAAGLGSSQLTAITNAAQEEYSRIAEAVQNCSVAPNAPTVAHVYKFMAAERSQIRDPCLPTNLESHDEDHTSLILGVARVLSGSLKTGKSYYAMGPKHLHTDSNIVPKRAIRLYLLMGSSFVLVDEVPAGHLCGVYNLEDTQLKTITLSDSPHGMPLTAMEQGIRPLVKVNVEAQEASDTIALERGLRKLALADAAVEVTATAKGERLLACLGEIHLEQSILDLRNVYCGREIKLRISDPIVDFGETTDWLMEGHLRLTLHSSMAGLGPLYSVLNKRRGKVLDDSMVDGADLLMITALIPQAEAFGLAPELYSNTSGEVTAPELNFSHWDRLDVDPFWIPTSLEEREDFGELQMAGDMSTGLDNTALKYIRKVREQKGLTTDSARTVLNAEKQRTLKR
ncbi:predicted protein [Phaeodactylum tricornutum CCAP 1055/1]|uniref:Tr-type G domain-containing protein n=2 Tax=Phaeodactylum tricornutum TaxID=2850 RepID=B7FZP5_PHATC|nr:predicted protein [Phaeodactylum tricornutum CCAP 1055/1]EEC48173.1 predicted protein [Phaeodactylum tricornutum CCAP 1055/1]|eukprot:XP_002179982.1 predicted protein [Phaeodactylum tricornutum CCAP 1055/1]